MKSYHILSLAGDGIGPEIMQSALGALDSLAERFGFKAIVSHGLIGGIAIDETGDPFPKETQELSLRADAILLGAVGGPKWDKTAKRPEQGLLAIRKALGLYANLRPVLVDQALVDHSPLKASIVTGTDMLIVRELTGGIYFGKRTRTETEATDECLYTVAEIERVAHIGFKAAQKRRKRLTSVDKANVIETSRLWRETVSRIGRDHYREIELEHALVDSMAMHLVTRPTHYDVILTENMFGDILSDLASVLPGSIGLMGSASLGDKRSDGALPGLYEPIHGSAPDIAGRDLANPIGMLRSLAMMLRFSLNETEAADHLDTALDTCLSDGESTKDLGGIHGCLSLTKVILERL